MQNDIEYLFKIKILKQTTLLYVNKYYIQNYQNCNINSKSKRFVNIFDFCLSIIKKQNN